MTSRLSMSASLLFVCFIGLVPARAQTCAALVNALDGYEMDRSDCVCGEALKKIVVAPPRGLRLVGACGLTTDGVNKINVKKTRLVVDDHVSGLEGYLYFAGPIELQGTAWRHITEASEMGFAPEFGFNVSWPASDKRAGFRELISTLQFEDQTTEQALDVKHAFHGKPTVKKCGIAASRIRVQGIKWAETDGDYRGAFALGTQVLEVGAYHACPAHWGQQQGR